jgi:hypothetical protein
MTEIKKELEAKPSVLILTRLLALLDGLGYCLQFALSELFLLVYICYVFETGL